MIQRRIATSAVTLLALVLCASSAPAEMGPCRRDGQDSSYCGEGDGAARIIPNTTSPSHRLALAWRLTNRPPTNRPNENDPDLESLIVRTEDGAILAKSHGTYWHLGERHAPHQYLSAAWSSNSRLLVRTAGSNKGPDSAELFVLAWDDAVAGPINLVKVLRPAVGAKMEGIRNADEYVLKFCYKPEVMIDDEGLIRASVYMVAPDMRDGPVYELTAKTTQAAGSIDVKVLSVSQYKGPYISVTVH